MPFHGLTDLRVLVVWRVVEQGLCECVDETLQVVRPFAGDDQLASHSFPVDSDPVVAGSMLVRWQVVAFGVFTVGH
jgi:hypothetical protein